MSDKDFEVALVLSGGNALGAYQAGAYAAMHEAGLEPDWIVGASAGAINGAIICGNPAERRISALREFWRPAVAGQSLWNAVPTAFEDARRTMAVAATITSGVPGVFAPRQIYGPWWNPLGNSEAPSAYDLTPLRGTLEKLIDFPRLNANQPRLSITAVDLETGEDVLFDTGIDMFGPDHIRASAALLPAFSPVEIEGRILGDGGISLNLPLDIVLSEDSERPILCFAIDLLPLAGKAPRTFGEALLRVQDLAFATQSRRAIAGWQALYDARAQAGNAGSLNLIHLVYSDQDEEVSGKAFDFSPRSLAKRWERGAVDMKATLERLPDLRAHSPSGLSVHVPTRSETGEMVLRPVRHALKPARSRP